MTAHRLTRRASLGLALSLATPGLLRAAEAVTVTDLLGRRVTLPRPAKRIVLGQGRLLPIMGLLHPDPASLLVGWSGDLRIVLPDENDAWIKRFPRVARLPEIGRRMGADMSIEGVAVLQPDLIIVTRNTIRPIDRDGVSEGLRKIEALGVPVAVVDFTDAPLTETARSLRILGALLHREAQAEALASFYESRMARIRAWAAESKPRTVPVMFHNHGGGRDCCYTIATTSFADLLLEAGGRSIAADILSRPLGQLNREWVMTKPSEAYITSGGVYNGRGGVSLGAGIAPEEAARSLKAMLEAQRLTDLPPVEAGRAYGIWHGFNETPQHVAAIEKFATWLHPESRAYFDADATLAIFNERFAAVPSIGTYWTGLPA
ncbi:ABC transporter substrate-binding protein [Acetobacteraceae bacterium H6797]|nr:ABC transporter substrate-binding protein [Acetobacteraceae bacterium H6797]